MKEKFVNTGNCREKQFPLKKYTGIFLPALENNVTGRIVYLVESLNGEFMSSILHLLLLIYYSIFICLDPDRYSLPVLGTCAIFSATAPLAEDMR